MTNQKLLEYTPPSKSVQLYQYSPAIQETNITTYIKIPATTTCNGKIHRQNRSCKKSAGWGTDHLGTGRCKLHGGCSTGAKSGTLRYSDCIPASVIEKYEEFSQESDDDIKSLNDEIALVRAKITRAEEINNEGRLDIQICAMVELVRKLTESKQKIEVGIKSHVTIEVVYKIVDSFIGIVEKYVSDHQTKRMIAKDLRQIDYNKLGMSVN